MTLGNPKAIWRRTGFPVYSFIALLLGLGAALANIEPVSAQFGEPILIGFESFEPGTPIRTVSSDGLTVTVTVESNGAVNEAVVFDSANPTGNDPDLGTPNENCPGGGPGISSDGSGSPGMPGENCEPLGNVLIIQENPPGPDGTYIPDDEANGGTITFEFSEGIIVNYFDLLDFEEETVVEITFFDVNGNQLGGAVTPIGFGDNSYERLFPGDVGVADGITRIVMLLPISGAIDDIEIVRTAPPDALGSIGDTIFCDANDNGVPDPGEGLAGVTVTLSNAGGTVETATTDANGLYLFADLPLGDYTVTVSDLPVICNIPSVDPDGGNDNMSSVTLTSDVPDDLDQDFGYVAPEPLGSIGDTIFCDANDNGVPDPGEGLAGITVTLSNAGGTVETATTDANGLYLFADLPLGDFTVTVSDLPVSCNIPSVDPDGGNDNMSSVTLTSDVPDDLDQDFGYVAPPAPLGSIGDTIFCDANDNGVPDPGEGLAGVTVALSNAGGTVETATTDANGLYLFADLPLGDYTVTVSDLPVICNIPSVDPDGGNDNMSSVTLTSDVPDDLDQDFGYVAPEPLGSIGDTIFCDANDNGVPDPGEGLAGVTVTLSNAGGTVETATTDANGLYLFADLPLGDFTVTVSDLPVSCNIPSVDPDGGNDNMSSVTLTSDVPDDLDQDFGYVAPPAPLGSIGDTIFCDANDNGVPDPGEGLAGVTVALSNAGGTVETATTDANGLYLFADLPLGDYTVTVSDLPVICNIPSVDPDGGNDNMSSVTLTSDVPDDLDQDFGYVAPEPLGCIGDTVWLDVNANGVQDPGEVGISGINVTITDASGAVVGSQLTNGIGFYQKCELRAAEYTVAVVGVPETLVQTYQLGGPPLNGRAVASLSTGQVRDDVDFGFAPTEDNLVSVGDFVWLDANKDGLQSAGELGLPGVDVRLFNSADDLVAQTRTDAQGRYLFGDLLPDFYSVLFNLPDDFEFTIQNAGNGVLDSQADPATGRTPSVNVPTGSNLTFDGGVIPIVRLPELIINKDVNSAVVIRGGTATYAISYANVGNADAEDVQIVEAIPSGTSFVSELSTSGWSCSENTCTFDVGTLATEEEGAPLEIAFQIDIDLPGTVTQIVNNVTISASNAVGGESSANVVIQVPTDIDESEEPDTVWYYYIPLSQ